MLSETPAASSQTEAPRSYSAPQLVVLPTGSTKLSNAPQNDASYVSGS